jgi:hypothetical protein
MLPGLEQIFVGEQRWLSLQLINKEKYHYLSCSERIDTRFLNARKNNCKENHIRINP